MDHEHDAPPARCVVRMICIKKRGAEQAARIVCDGICERKVPRMRERFRGTERERLLPGDEGCAYR